MNTVTGDEVVVTLDVVTTEQATATVRSPTTPLKWSDGALGVFRIAVALLFLMHGTAKLFGWPQGTPADFLAWPMWWAGALEVVLGALIAIGLFTRPAAFLASGMMAVAYFWRHFPDGFWPIVNNGETAVLYCFVFLMLVITGPGAFAVSRRT